MFITMMSSESCDWVALGKTVIESREALLKHWNDEQKRLGDLGWDVYPFETVEDLEEEYGMYTTAIELNGCIKW